MRASTKQIHSPIQKRFLVCLIPFWIGTESKNGVYNRQILTTRVRFSENIVGVLYPAWYSLVFHCFAECFIHVKSGGFFFFMLCVSASAILNGVQHRHQQSSVSSLSLREKCSIDKLKNQYHSDEMHVANKHDKIFCHGFPLERISYFFSSCLYSDFRWISFIWDDYGYFFYRYFSSSNSCEHLCNWFYTQYLLLIVCF